MFTEVFMFKKTVFVMLALVLALAACAPSPKPTDVMEETPTHASGDMMESPTEAMMDKPTDAAGMSDDPMLETPTWFGVTLINVRTGEDFSINDFKGKVVLVEDLAMWCSNCKKQQNQVKILLEDIGMMDDLVLIGLDIDPNENATDLKTYIDNNGFSWIYAVAPVEVTREIGNLYGDQFLNPPSTPMFLVDRKGQVHPLPFGIKSADDLKNFIEPFLSDSM
jgi:thiol-disulfide isomerase/thioredoxin